MELAVGADSGRGASLAMAAVEPAVARSGRLAAWEGLAAARADGRARRRPHHGRSRIDLIIDLGRLASPRILAFHHFHGGLHISCRKKDRERDSHHPYKVVEITPPPRSLAFVAFPRYKLLHLQVKENSGGLPRLLSTL
ncbi:hypothetical protein NL676_012365 [Syzygium grande]|nr:hypothetical protein NL676_012365 [Syzygium grande]